MANQQYFNAMWPSDQSGTGAWRFLWQNATIEALGDKTGIFNSVITKPVFDQNWYQGLNSFMVQRLISQQQRRLFEGLVIPLSKLYSFWTIYNLDDAPHYKDICPYNRGRWAYAKDDIQENIRSMMNNADFVVTTTNYLKGYFNRTYGVPEDNIIVIPNYLPRWWIGGKYDKEKSVENFRRSKNKGGKLRIGMVSSLSHYNVDGIRQDPETKDVIKKVEEVDPKTGEKKEVWKNPIDKVVTDISKYVEVKDDLDVIIETIEKTVDTVQWVFFGYAPPKLEKYIKEGKIECHGGVNIYNYPEKFASLQLNAVVAPLQDNEFNRCKSNIKWLECAALGIPLLAQNINTYSNYMPERQLFNNADDLLEKIQWLQKMSASVFGDIIENQWKWINSPHKEGGWNSPNWWLESNYEPWIKLWQMRHKSSELSLAKYIESKKRKEKEAKESVVFSKNNGELLISK